MLIDTIENNVVSLFNEKFSLDQALLGAAIDQFPANIYWVDTNHIARGGNQRLFDCFQIHRDDYIGHKLDRLAEITTLTHEQLKLIMSQDRKVIETGQVLVFNDAPILLPDGLTCRFRTTRAPLWNSRGEIIGVVGISQPRAVDETDRLGEMPLPAISFYHQVKTPIEGLITDLENIVDTSSPLVTQKLAPLLAKARYLREVVDDEFELGRHAASKKLDRAQPYSLEPIILNVSVAYSKLSEKNDVSLSIDVKKLLPQLTVSKAVINNVLGNLFSNALKYTKNGHLLVTAKQGDSREDLVLSFSDTGIGVHPEHHEKIFEYSFQEGRGPNVNSGMGFGLYQVKKHIVDGFGGEILIESELNKGFTIVLLIPNAFK